MHETKNQDNSIAILLNSALETHPALMHFINYFKQIAPRPIHIFSGKFSDNDVRRKKNDLQQHYILINSQQTEPEKLLALADYVVDFVNPTIMKKNHFNLSDNPSPWRIEHTVRRITKKTIGIALCSGGAPGMAHLGVLKVLQEEKIPLDYIAGTSSGSICGGIFATGFPLDAALEVIKKHAKPSTLTIALKNPSFTLKGIMNGKYLMDILYALFGDQTIEQAQIPFAAVASDLISGQCLIYNIGSFMTAVRASCTIPFLINPIEDGKHLIIDGIATAPLPINVLENENIDIKIAVPIPQLDLITPIDIHAKLFTIYLRTYSLLAEQIVNYSKSRADIIISPQVEGIKLLDWKKLDKVVAAGETAAKESLLQIRQILKGIA